jgi:hypothetical protein
LGFSSGPHPVKTNKYAMVRKEIILARGREILQSPKERANKLFNAVVGNLFCGSDLSVSTVHGHNEEPSHFIRYAALASTIPNYPFSKVVFS